jgi:hypothetical protein
MSEASLRTPWYTVFERVLAIVPFLVRMPVHAASRSVWRQQRDRSLRLWHFPLETAFRMSSTGEVLLGNASAWNKAETKRTLDLFARTLNIFKDDLRSILAQEWKERRLGAANPVFEARLSASVPDHAHRVLPPQ